MTTMYKSLAKYYDLIYSWKDFEGEAKKVHALIKKHKICPGNELLEIACGTGNHAQYLKQWYDITGLDKSKDMLFMARKKLPKLSFVQADMMTFQLQKFDVITTLFSSVGYVRNYTNLKRTIRNFSQHLNTGGVLIIEPFIEPDKYQPGTTHVNVQEEKNVKICRMNTSKRKGNMAIIDFHFLIGTSTGTTHLVDHHELGMFEPKKVLQIMHQAGLRGKYLKNGLMKNRGLYVAVKQ